MGKTLLSIGLAAVFMISCRTGSSAQTDGGKLSPEAFAKQMKTYSDDGQAFVLLDVRTPEELQETGMIEGAEHMDYYSVDFKSNLEELDRDQPILVYCRSGGRSGQTAGLLEGLGFATVFDLDGGISAWLAQGMKTEKP